MWVGSLKPRCFSDFTKEYPEYQIPLAELRQKLDEHGFTNPQGNA